MTTSNPLSEPPQTPFPDPAEASAAATDPEPPVTFPPSDPLEPVSAIAAPDSTTSDDLDRMLATSIEKPEPDPMLGAAEPTGLDLHVRFTPSPDAGPRRRAAERSRDGGGGDARRPSNSWGTLLLASYASAVTMALIWVLATNRGLRPRAAAVPPPPAAAWGRGAAGGPSAASKPSDDRITTLGAPLLVGDLEITPIEVRFQDVNLFRVVDPKGAKRRKVEDCLVLTLRLTNRSSDHRLTPLELASVRDSADSAGSSFIESATGERIGMFELAMESEWSIELQSFPSVKPGQSEDVILVSEPITDRKLASPLVWRITIQAAAGGSEEIGVRFDRQEIGEPNR